MHKNAQKFISEKLRVKFPVTTHGYSMMKIARNGKKGKVKKKLKKHIA